MVGPIEDDYYIVPAGGHSPGSPGEGSPRHSGEEADPFLNRNSQMRQSGSGVPAGAAAVANDGSLSSSNKSSAASGYGTLLDRPSISVRSTPPEQRRGNILSPEELRRLDEESVLPPITDFGPATHPPRLITNSDHHLPLPRMNSRGSIAPPIQPWELAPVTNKPSQNSITPSLQDEPTVVTARRVRMDSSAISPPAESPAEGSSNRPSSWKALGLAGLARLSWFKNNGSSPSSRRQSLLASDNDVEAGRALLDAPGERPISTFSTKSTGAASGPSVYHDARSSIPGTPLLAPLPRALAPDSVDPEFGGWPGIPGSHPDEPSDTTTTTTNVDILDMPAPRGISPFASTSSLRDSLTTSSISKKNYPHPPGLAPSLALSTPAVWNETSGGTPSVGSFAAHSSVAGNRQSTAITIDVLEQAPPAAGQSWRSLAGADPDNKRTTFGLPNYMQTPDFASEHASLHSMRSHLSPSSSRSAGSAPASRRDGSGSQSSRRTGSSGPSLVHSNSLSSDGRRHARGPSSPHSPTLSVFGEGLRPMPFNPMIESDGPHSRSASNSNSHSHSSHLGPLPEGVAIGGLLPNHSKADSEQSPTSPTLSATAVPWAMGLDKNWTAS